jgi:hypothetical protein
VVLFKIKFKIKFLMKEIEYAARHVTLVFASTLIWASEQINREWLCMAPKNGISHMAMASGSA